MKPSFCSQCGRVLDNETAPPWRCLLGHETWDNPVPVAVCVQPVYRHGLVGTTGLAVARRAIEPALGTWCFLGGHVENTGETIEEAAAREFREEAGIEPGAAIGITKSYTNGRGHVLLAVEFMPISHAAWKKAKLCPENSEFAVLWELPKEPLGFPIHQRIAEEWFYGA